MSDDSTLDVNRHLGESDFLRTGWDLLVEEEGRPPRRVPICQLQTTLGGETSHVPAAGVKAVLKYQGEKVFFTDLGSAGDAILNENPVRFAELTPADQLRVGGLTLRLVPSGDPWLAALECYSEPYQGRYWGLTGQEASLGRAGKRANRIELADRTISREHATLNWRDGGFVLLAEGGHTLVNGQALSAGESCALADGDLLRLGELLFRLRLAERAPAGQVTALRPVLRIHCLKRFEVFRGSERVEDRAYRSHLVRHLLALVSSQGPQPNERLLELFWPDEPLEKARRNLTWCVSTLRSCLKPCDYLERTSSFLQMAPEAPIWNDYLELDRLLREGSLASREMALEVYRGPFMPDCYMDWAVEIQEQLAQRVLEGGLQVLAWHESQADHDAVMRWGRQLTSLDPCCQGAYGGMMRACVAQGRAQEALRLFEQCRRNLEQGMGLEPSTELLRDRQRALME